ncbi:hypothetical protein ACOJBO_02095 [Rhizobium beringeri]
MQTYGRGARVGFMVITVLFSKRQFEQLKSSDCCIEDATNAIQGRWKESSAPPTPRMILGGFQSTTSIANGEKQTRLSGQSPHLGKRRVRKLLQSLQPRGK